MPVPFMARLLLNRPKDASVPHTSAQIIGSVVVTLKMPRVGSSGSASKVRSLARTSSNGRTDRVELGSSLPHPTTKATVIRRTAAVLPRLRRLRMLEPARSAGWIGDADGELASELVVANVDSARVRLHEA